MNLYKKMYSILFNAVTDALRDMEEQNFGRAKERLVKAQQQAEEAFVEEKE